MPQTSRLFDPNAYDLPTPLSSAPMVPGMGRFGGQGHLFNATPFDRQSNRPSTTEAVGHVTASPQLKMFMTPKEIHAGWSPLDGDRHDSYDDGGGTWEGTYSPKSWDTGNTMPTDVNAVGTDTYRRADRRYPGVHSGPGGEDTGTIRRTRGGGKYRLHDRGSAEESDNWESDEDLWSRKLEESQEWGRTGQHGEFGMGDPLNAHTTMGSYQGQATGASAYYVGKGPAPSSSALERHYERQDAWEYQRAEHGDGQGESLYDSVAREGVKGPVRLGQQIGSMGKPMIVGGHHRLAAATEAAPDRLLPVLHDTDIYSAQRPGPHGYPYS